MNWSWSKPYDLDREQMTAAQKEQALAFAEGLQNDHLARQAAMETALAEKIAPRIRQIEADREAKIQKAEQRRVSQMLGEDWGRQRNDKYLADLARWFATSRSTYTTEEAPDMATYTGRYAYLFMVVDKDDKTELFSIVAENEEDARFDVIRRLPEGVKATDVTIALAFTAALKPKPE